ncbi:hypothetical protein [Rugamonas sp. DEMB1]|uniref:hypothetical protein n=1 Tax=Rugamonas sp. DEMB1 TaxID=3039386 RepID=UPI00244965D1|nr:hypothetical protein [Rugamonas sp. DEMB1]WGG49887.1 hypothetical protein QC826_25950 [Rugamonas sp. DEMB1]
MGLPCAPGAGALLRQVRHPGKENGSGLGTCSARLIAQAHGGSIAMATSEQDGTTLTIQLPG